LVPATGQCCCSAPLRSEALAIGDIENVSGRGSMLTISRSKTDQVGAGQRVAVHANPARPGCRPAAALGAWRPAHEAGGRG